MNRQDKAQQSDAAGLTSVASKDFKVAKQDGTHAQFDIKRILKTINWAIRGCEKFVVSDIIIKEALKNVFDGADKINVAEALILSAAVFIEKDPAYSKVAARLLLKKLYKEVSNSSIHGHHYQESYRTSFIDTIKQGVAISLFDKRLAQFDLNALSCALVIERDELFEYMGLKTLYERYFIKMNRVRKEMPQAFWMRVAMGIAINEDNMTERAIEFYHLMSQLHYVPSTPTLLHSGLVRAQLSSCFLATVEDDLKHIFKCIGDNAQLSKWSGGVAYDWTNIRATGSLIKSVQVESQGVVPFLKISSDVTAAINRSGKRRSASCVYLETWHLDIEDFLDLRRNTGDERRRTHDINTAHWIPDLFIKRVIEEGSWTLFSPNDVPDLHDLYGKAFEVRYHEYEQQALQGNIEQFKVVQATKLWRKMLSRLFETGHPWITFKDPCNVRSPQDHVGVVHSSNLCTEITLNTSADETAVCNLGSVNVSKHISGKSLNKTLLAQTVRTAMRMLDNVIDLNFYPTEEAKTANDRHRPVGLGVMGFQDALYMMEVPFDDQQALIFADELQEQVAYCAITASSELAKERGTYKSYKGSKWDRAIFPQDTIDLLQQERGVAIAVKRGGLLDWKPVRSQVKQYGMRNSNVMAIAPTATISNIVSCFPCIEPIYKNLYVKANMSGEFTVVNTYLVRDLKKHDLWNEQMIEQLKYHDGSVQYIKEIPESIKRKYKEAFELDPEWLIEITAARGKWIDQSQSHNVFMRGVSGAKLNSIYLKAWHYGLKTTYYLRTLGASQIEKSTLDASKFGFTQKRDSAVSKMEESNSNGMVTPAKACSLIEPDCDVCQ